MFCSLTKHGIFGPTPGAEFRPHSQSKIATVFPNIMSDFPIQEFELFDTLMEFLKEFSKKIDFEQNHQTTKNKAFMLFLSSGDFFQNHFFFNSFSESFF